MRARVHPYTGQSESGARKGASSGASCIKALTCRSLSQYSGVTQDRGSEEINNASHPSSCLLIMKAISPVRSVRSCYKAVCCISEQSLAISRNRHACADEPAGALCDMNDCYSKLKELVPSIPQNKSVSQVEILQHVIDYIFDLQIALEAEDAAAPEMVLSIQTADLTHKFPKDEGRLCH